MKKIVAVVGMPGAGKSEVTEFFEKKGIPFVRFGDLTDEGLMEMGLIKNEINEKIVREKLRKDLGMAAYAIKAKSKIEELLRTQETIVIDGLYSWEEYVYLKKELRFIILLAVYARPKIRYERLSKRKIRPLTIEEAKKRDIAEIESLNKGGPIALSDFLIKNEKTREDLYQELEQLLDLLNHDLL